MKKLFMLLIIAFALQSCENKTQKKSKEIKEQNITANSSNNSANVENQDKLKIKYSDHKNLLDILTKLPEYTMESWKWSEKDRIDFVKFIQKNDYTFNSSSHFSKFSLIGPNTIGIQIVDGYWTLAIYKIQANNYIVITDDVVGDGNSLLAFEYKDGKLNDVGFDNLFDENFFSSLLINYKDECEDLLEDNLIGFEYDFSHTTNLTISNSHYLKKDEHQNCLKGNTMKYKFNPKTKKFDLTAINWKESNE